MTPRGSKSAWVLPSSILTYNHSMLLTYAYCFLIVWDILNLVFLIKSCSFLSSPIMSSYMTFYYHMTVGTGEDQNCFFHSLYYIRTSYVEGSYFYQIILVVDIGSSNINVLLIWIFGNQVWSCLIFAKNEEKFWHSWLSLAWWEIGIDKLAVFLFEDILPYWLLKI